MPLLDVEIFSFRNLNSVGLELGSGFNVFYGNNGSGKTSFIEAIHHLALGRSFRTRLSKRIIQKNAEKFSVFARLQKENQPQLPLGIEKDIRGNTRIRIAGEDAHSAVELAKLLPLQLIYPDGHQLLVGGSKPRRQFLDWGVFHVEPSFIGLWQQAMQVIKQRNAGLRQQHGLSQLTIWDEQLIVLAEQLHQMRQNYIAKLIVTFQQLWQQLMGGVEIKLTYYAGWSKEKSLAEALSSALGRDRQLGYTQNGPHRADLRFHIDAIPANDVLSQGQQKILIYVLQLTQGIMLRQQTGQQCIYLIDDLPAELDEDKRRKITEILVDLQAQVIVTGINKTDLSGFEEYSETKMFHVEHGKIYG